MAKTGAVRFMRLCGTSSVSRQVRGLLEAGSAAFRAPHVVVGGVAGMASARAISPGPGMRRDDGVHVVVGVGTAAVGVLRVSEAHTGWPVDEASGTKHVRFR